MPIIAVPSSPEDAELVRAFEENEFDIAGLADLTDDGNTLTLALHELHLILINGTKPRRSNRVQLARVLLAMTTVARNDYAASGHQEYWRFLFDRIAEAAVTTIDRGQFACIRTQPNQSLLGDWFRFALDEFGYTIPEEGQTYVGPIVFHAGIPRTSLAGAVQLVDTAVRQFAQSAVNLPYDLRTQLAHKHFPPLHRNVERLLASQLSGATQLWSSLARVVLAWQQCGDCTAELRQLPAAIDPEDVRRALPGRDGSIITRRPRTALPQLRFDAASGEVRLTFPSGTPNVWKVTDSGGRPIELRWQQTHLGLTAELLAPPPEEMTVEQQAADGIRRTLVTHPSDWPGIWFHASTGNLEDGATIDANGLEPGRWYVLFEGTPTRWSVPSPYRVQLKCSCFSGHQHWTAWEVEVPVRTSDQTRLACHVDDNCFHVPLARRPGARVKVQSSAIASATTAQHEAVEVFAESPVVRLCRDRSLAVTILREREGEIETLSRHEIAPDQDWRIPVKDPGVFQLREARGVGRILLHFAVIPRARISKPMYDSKKDRVAVEVRHPDATGVFVAAATQHVTKHDGLCRVEQSTVEPELKIEWHWRNHIAVPLTFRWTVEGLRWRVLRLGGDAARWTRDAIFVSPKEVERHDAELEIQVPSRADLKVNEQSWSVETLERRVGGAGISLSLFSYGEVVSVSTGDEEPRTAVIKSDRPSISSLDVLCDGESAVVTWEANTAYSDIVLLAWNPIHLNAEPKQFPAAGGAIELSCAELPGDLCSLAIARLVRVGFTRKVLQLAAAESDPTRLQSLILNVRTGETSSPKYDSPETWTEFLHGLTINRLNGSLPNTHEIVTLLSAMEADNHSTIDRYLELDSGLADAASPFDIEWRAAARQALVEQITTSASRNPARVLANENGRALFARLLRLGVPIGQSCPHKWLAEESDCNDGSGPYPFSFFQDLWLLGTCDVAPPSRGSRQASGTGLDLREPRQAAARRIWDSLNACGLDFTLQLLPMLQRTAFTQNTDEGHQHFVSLPPRRVETVSDFLDALGLGTVALDCQATCDDSLRKMHGKKKTAVWHDPKTMRVMPRQHCRELPHKYSLLWDHEERQWYIERPGASPPTCCLAQTLFVPEIRMDKLIDALALRQVLDRWAKMDLSPRHNGRPLAVPDHFAQRLATDPVTGYLHTELPPRRLKHDN